MPQLARGRDPAFPGYFEALSSMGNAHVRFAPWFGYPRAAVLELEPADCGAGGGSSFNSSVLDGTLADFMLAVCGPRAALGECAGGRSVVPQLSTMPAWLYVPDGKNRTPPEDPWAYPLDDMNYYVVRGQPLVDPTCGAMARYAARYVAHYTAGGHTDECGVVHPSGLFYNWPLLSVLNEDEYDTPPHGGIEYTICFDAWKAEIAKVNPRLRLIGPEIATNERAARGSDVWNYSAYFLDPSSHADGAAPGFVSLHVALDGKDGAFDDFFAGVDEWTTNFLAPLMALSPAGTTQFIVNEYIPFMNSWCEIPPDAPPGEDCDWQSNRSAGVRMNRVTLGWNAAAASCAFARQLRHTPTPSLHTPTHSPPLCHHNPRTVAYAYGRFSELGLLIAGQDQLIGGPYPNNEPAVASLDWDTGEPNAKYWATRVLAEALGTAPRDLFNSSVAGGGGGVAPLYSLAMQVPDAGGGPARRVLLLVSKTSDAVAVALADGGFPHGSAAIVLEGAGAEPGFNPPVARAPDAASGALSLGPYAVAVVTLGEH